MIESISTWIGYFRVLRPSILGVKNRGGKYQKNLKIKINFELNHEKQFRSIINYFYETGIKYHMNFARHARHATRPDPSAIYSCQSFKTSFGPIKPDEHRRTTRNKFASFAQFMPKSIVIGVL